MNRFSSSLDMDAAARRQFVLGPVTLTRMAGPAESMRLEQDYIQVLDSADAYGFEKGSLVLRQGSQDIARFNPAH